MHWALRGILDRSLGILEVVARDTTGRLWSRCRGHALDGILIHDRAAKPSFTRGRRGILARAYGTRGHWAGEVYGSQRVVLLGHLSELAGRPLPSPSRSGAPIQADTSASASWRGGSSTVRRLEAGRTPMDDAALLLQVLWHWRNRRRICIRWTPSAGRWRAKGALRHGS